MVLVGFFFLHCKIILATLLLRGMTFSNPTPSSVIIIKKSLSHALQQCIYLIYRIKGMLRVSKAASEQLF